MTTDSDDIGGDYRRGFEAGAASRQAEIDALESAADRYYRLAFHDERRRFTFPEITPEELEERRRVSEPPPSITREQALASWGYEPALATTGDTPDPATTSVPIHPNRRRATMPARTIVGNLATDPEPIQAGRVQIVKLRVIENTGEYRRGEWVEHETPTTHFVEARFELGENALASLHRGDSVIVVGQEHSQAWDRDGQKQYGRVITADAIGPNLTRATAEVHRTAVADRS